MFGTVKMEEQTRGKRQAKDQRYREKHPDRVKASRDAFYQANRDEVLRQRRQKYAEAKLARRVECPLCSGITFHCQKYLITHIQTRHGTNPAEVMG